MKYMKILGIILFVIMSVVPQSVAARAYAEESDPLPVIISDTFSIDGVNRTVGSQLNGSQTEVGYVNWTTKSGQWAYPNAYVFAETAGEQYIKPSASDSLQANVPFEPQQNSQMSVEADLWPDSNGTGFMAIGFNKGESEFWYDGQIWMNIRGNGAYEIYANGTAIPIGQGTSTAFIPNQMNKLKVSYDSSLKTVTAWVNNEQVVDHFSLGSFTPDIQYTGFMVTSGDVNVQRIDNFVVRGVRVPLPEPTLPVVISDTFSIDGVNRTVGSQLNGSQTEVGYVNWTTKS
ncbi:hypothetical protein, partial [Cohnella soli]